MGDAIQDLPAGRHLAVDERGVGLRATWRLDRGFLNLSLWRDDRCVETFHLTPAAAADLVSFLARGLADASAIAAAAIVRVLPQENQPSAAKAMFVHRAVVSGARRRIAATLAALAARVAP